MVLQPLKVGQEYSNLEELNPVQVVFRNSRFLQSTPQGYSCLAITNDVVLHFLFIEAEEWH